MNNEKFPSGATAAGAIVGALTGTLIGGIRGALLGLLGGGFVALLLAALLFSAHDVLQAIRDDWDLFLEELLWPVLVLAAVVGLIVLGVLIWGGAGK